MFWGNDILEKVKERFADQIHHGKVLVIRDEKTASGRVHVGSMRGVAIHGVVNEVFRKNGIQVKYLYEINDFDPMDGLPVYLDRETFLPHMGKPLYLIPSPDGKAKNYAEYFAEEFIGVIREAGFSPEYYRSSELYLSGKYNDVIRTALEQAPKIREIYQRVSGSVKPNDWYPLQVICEQCGKIGTTKVRRFDGEQVTYRCEESMVDWARGCGYEGCISPFDGRAKLPWKVEWAAKFKIVGVHVEGCGKDHSTRGGSRQIADALSREVFGYEPPVDIPYEFFLVGGKKMSSSKGAGSSSREVAELLPQQLFRFLLVGKDPRKVIDFIPDGDTLPLLYDMYDTFAESYFSGVRDDRAEIFEFSHGESSQDRLQPHFLPRFSQGAFLVQMPHMDFLKEVMTLKGSELTDLDKREALERAEYAKRWLEHYAPEQYRYVLQKTVPTETKNLSETQKRALQMLLSYIEHESILDGQKLHTELHELKEKANISPKELFTALYMSFLGKTSGPKAGWFLSVLPREFLIERLRGVIK